MTYRVQVTDTVTGDVVDIPHATNLTRDKAESLAKYLDVYSDRKVTILEEGDVTVIPDTIALTELNKFFTAGK